ncbi:MAG: hypothetical protein ACE5FS_11120 [Paracoccaceae bacterium]
MKKRFAVVYQIGKVASTSIVATLNEIDAVEAVQSHFLGKYSLMESLATLTSEDISDYFFEHQIGQFIENARLTRRIRAIRSGRADERLLVISLTRDPLDWFRSSVVQDMDGHLPNFRVLLDSLGVAYGNDSNAVVIALTRLFNVYAKILHRFDGIDNTVKLLRVSSDAVFDGSSIENDLQSRRFFYMMLRPFDWFQKHFQNALDIKLEDMSRSDGISRYSDETGDFFIIRYEDLQNATATCLAEIGIKNMPKLKRENISKDKLFSEETKKAFLSPAAERLNSFFKKSEYSKTFGYS